MLSSILFALLLAGAAQQSTEEPKPAEPKPAAIFFVWTLIALGLTAIFSQ